MPHKYPSKPTIVPVVSGKCVKKIWVYKRSLPYLLCFDSFLN